MAGSPQCLDRRPTRRVVRSILSRLELAVLVTPRFCSTSQRTPPNLHRGSAILSQIHLGRDSRCARSGLVLCTPRVLSPIPTPQPTLERSRLVPAAVHPGGRATCSLEMTGYGFPSWTSVESGARNSHVVSRAFRAVLRPDRSPSRMNCSLPSAEQILHDVLRGSLPRRLGLAVKFICRRIPDWL